MLRKISYYILFIGLVIFVNSCNEATHKTKINKAEEKQTLQFKKDAIAMALKYNAISNCEENIRNINRDIYSIDLEDNLISKDDRPVLLNVIGISDIVKINNKFNVLFIGEIADETFLMRLEATPEKVKAIKDHPDIYEKYAAIIAQISSITNKMYEKTENEGSNRFIADGRCIALLFFTDTKSP